LEKTFWNSEYTEFEIILMKTFCKYRGFFQNFSWHAVLEILFGWWERVSCKTFEKHVEIHAIFWNKILWKLLFSKSKHFSFGKISNQKILKLIFVLKTKSCFLFFETIVVWRWFQIISHLKGKAFAIEFLFLETFFWSNTLKLDLES
jgi:hypothetical protein